MEGGSMGTRILYESPDRSMTLATLGCLFITIHRRDFSAEELVPLRRHQLTFAAEHGAPFPILSILGVTERHILGFSRSASEASKELARETAPLIRCSGVVFDRGGFAASVVRSLVTTLNLIAKQPYPSQVFGELGAALTWIESKLDKQRPWDFDRAEIVASVKTLREASAPSEAPAGQL
jgi:hypothetical protein